MCEMSFKKDDVHIDHVIPVVDPIKGFVGWDDFIEKLFCDVDGFQILCKMDHEIKTMLEDEMRKALKTPKETIDES
jgi:hypothetical protein